MRDESERRAFFVAGALPELGALVGGLSYPGYLWWSGIGFSEMDHVVGLLGLIGALSLGRGMGELLQRVTERYWRWPL